MSEVRQMKRSSGIRACTWAVLLSGPIVLTGAGGPGQAAGSPVQGPVVWSVYVDPLRPPTTPAAADSKASSPDASTRRIAQTTQAWNWGDLVIGRTYRGEITLSNQCKTDQRVGLFVTGLPDLLIQPTATIPAGGNLAVPYRIVVTAPAGASDAIRGEVVVWLPSMSDSACPSIRIVHEVSGRARAATPADVATEKALLAHELVTDACARWWMLGEKPADRTESECAPIIRRISVRVRERIERFALATPEALSKVPAAQAINSMSMTELIAVRRDFAAALGTPGK
jgi:hypothetical protein